jgi:hypothetical protein
MPQLIAAFENDLCEMAEEELRTRGIPLWPWKQARRRERIQSLRQILTVRHRLIPSQPRRSAWSDTLVDRPGDQWSQEAFRIATESEDGLDLNHYLSSGLRRAAPDAQLNDWGLTHLHLGGRQEGKPFSLRSDELLFVVVRPDTVYFVDIGTHGSFSALTLFETVHRNWPQLLSRGRLPDNVSADSLSDLERATLRKKGANAITTTADGTAYIAPGLGQAASGVSTWAVMMADRMVDDARQFQRVCELNAAGIAKGADQLGIALTYPAEVRLIELGDQFVAYLPAAQLKIWGERGASTLKMSGPREIP